jgi:hypothetical protein
MVPGFSRTTVSHRSPVYLNGEFARVFQRQVCNLGRLAWLQAGTRRGTSVSQAAGSRRYRRAVVGRLLITALRHPASGWPMNSKFFWSTQLDEIAFSTRFGSNSYRPPSRHRTSASRGPNVYCITCLAGSWATFAIPLGQDSVLPSADVTGQKSLVHAAASGLCGPFATGRRREPPSRHLRDEGCRLG